MKIADLFCGAGGTSTGAEEALRALGHDVHLTAVNHWDIAVATHSANHPTARHFCASLDALNPRDLFAEGELDILWASPECTHHSVARGGRPVSDQSRATAWCVVRWAEALRPPVILVENVPEFMSWGPIGTNGIPLKSKRGELFRAWCSALEACGYRVDHRILCAADYGDPTTRRRLFVQAVRGRRRIVWPDPTHAPAVEATLFDRRPYRVARDVIDWSLQGQSIFDRKRPLSPKTLARIEAGLLKFGLSPFLVPQQSGHKTWPINRPLPAITTKGAEALVEPYIVAWDNQSGSGVWSADEPLSTIVTKARHGVAEPYLIELRGTSKSQVKGSSRSVDTPFPTITAGGGHVAVCEPFLVSYYGNGEALRVDAPLDTVTCKDRFGLVRPEIRIDGKRYLLDIRFRMLQPHELAAAQGFPVGYNFTGTKTQVVKQIGNAVPCGLARALVLSVMSQSNDISKYLQSEVAA
jgi:DNA (cytosine-5)-methyltransferase 1